jgi:phosphohistidine phosphatase SixA
MPDVNRHGHSKSHARMRDFARAVTQSLKKQGEMAAF